jgi:hypothetical protein
LLAKERLIICSWLLAFRLQVVSKRFRRKIETVAVGKSVSRIRAAVAPLAVGNAKFPARARAKSPVLNEGTERFNLLVSRAGTSASQ